MVDVPKKGPEDVRRDNVGVGKQIRPAAKGRGSLNGAYNKGGLRYREWLKAGLGSTTKSLVPRETQHRQPNREQEATTPGSSADEGTRLRSCLLGY